MERWWFSVADTQISRHVDPGKLRTEMSGLPKKAELQGMSQVTASLTPPPPLEPSPFLDPYAPIEQHKNRLPHWQQHGVFCFVTWRLADSLPAGRLAEWRSERAVWLLAHPEPWSDTTESEYHRHFTSRFDHWLDEGAGSCLLRDPLLAVIVADALRHFEGERYAIASFVVMPNHVHVLFRLLPPHRLQDVVKSWKGFTAREINRRTARTGALWGEDYWDRLIRNSAHFQRCMEYISSNPEKAGLREGEFVLSGEPSEGG